MAFNFAHLLSAACGGAPRRLGRLRRPWARCARLFWGGYPRNSLFLERSPTVAARPSPRLSAGFISRAGCISLPVASTRATD